MEIPVVSWFQSLNYVLCDFPWPSPFAPPTPPRPPFQWAFLALFVGFIATMTRSDFSCPVHHRLWLLAFPMRIAPLTRR